MIIFNSQSNWFRSLNVGVIVSMVFQIVAPSVQAMQFLSNTPEFFVKSKTFGGTAVGAFPVINRSEGIPSLESSALRADVSKSMKVLKVAGGPGQTESSGFSLNTTDGMVDQFTGDFSYSIPLMDVEGYPIVLSYSSNVGMMDEASWVGLGWNLNVGSVAREMRGIPDEFDGTQSIQRVYSVLDDDIEDGYKFGVTGGLMRKGNINKRNSKFGTDISVLFGGYDNNYTGYSKTFDFNIGASLAMGKVSSVESTDKFLGGRGGLGYSSDSKNGISRSTSVGFTASYGESFGATTYGQFGLNWGSNYHSRAGITQRGLSGGFAYGMSTYSSDNKNRTNIGLGYVDFGSSFNCGGITAVPRYEVNSTAKSSQWVYDATIGYAKKTSKWGFVVGIEGQTYHTDQSFTYTNSTDKTIVNPAFGYFNSQKRDNYTGSLKPIMDFNRERDGQFSEDMKHLAFSFPTYDVFYVNGMGMSATFRGIRIDIGVYKDPSGENTTNGSGKNVSGGVNISKGTPSPGPGIPGVPTNIDLTVGFVWTDQDGDGNSGQWENGSEFFQFGSDNLVQFKGIGEPTPKTNGLLNQIGGAEAAYLDLDKTENGQIGILKTDKLIYTTGSVNLDPTAIANANLAEVRANIYKPILASDVTFNVANHVYENGVFGPPTQAAFDRIDGTVHLKNHLSATEVMTSNGMKYVYGLPVYSINQSDVMFSSSQTDDDEQGLVTYTNTENSKDNYSAGMHLYDKTTVPSYATSFLLTGVQSSDYIDLTGNGYSVDDIGDYYKINYSRVYDQNNPFKWRFPMGDHKAFFNEGLLATDRDNMATYTYGEKEIWYTHSVESKNLIAEFTISNDRIDAMSVTDENGVRDNNKGLKKLAKITLYNRSERLAKGTSAKPLQTIEFIYDYSLCLNNPANKNYDPTNSEQQPETGKLTLKEIRVYSSAKSEETALHPYKFTYSEINPDFHYKSVDRWGNYHPDNDPARPLELYPYSEQNVSIANTNASAWKLTKIEMPSGSETEVEYEADSYRYVQDKRAMKHMDIKGYTTPVELGFLLDQATWNGSNRVGNQLHKKITDNDLSTMTGLSVVDLAQLSAFMYSQVVSENIRPVDDLALFRQKDQMPANVVVFQLETAISASSKAEADKAFREMYLKSDQSLPVGSGYVKEVYLRNLVQVKENSAYELIPTFAKIKENDLYLEVPAFGSFPATGVMPPDISGNYNYGYIVLQNVESSDNGMPIAMSPVQKTALEFSRLHLTDLVYGSCVGCDADLSVDRKAFWRGDLYKEMAKAGYANVVSTTMPSQIRVFDHDNKKIGGNARVSKVTIRDNWNTISGEEAAEYYWMYDYDRTSGYGVAAYEPASGNDENSFYSWERYTNKAASFPDESRFTVTPIGESLFPNPVVGYRTVRVTLGGDGVNPSNQLGYSQATFETAYEHPTITSSTGIKRVKADKNSIFKIEIDLFGMTEGHSVITNDFHGKPSDYRVYNANGDLQARTTYTYKTSGDPVMMMDKTGTITNESIASEYDFYADSRFVVSRFTMSSIGLSLSFPLAPTPSFIPNGFTPILSSSYKEVGFYAHAFNKHINRSAIVEKVETETMGSVNTAQDLVYDRENGAVLLTSLTDEYNEKLYSFTYPAHWYYTLFRNPLQQSTAGVSGTFSSGTFTSASGSLTDRFTVGDKVNVLIGGSTITTYVLSVNAPSGVNASSLRLINTSGAAYTASGSATLTVVQSGRRNMLSATMQGVVTKRNPLNGLEFTFPSQDVIEASAVSFRPRLNTLCRDYGGSEKISVVSGSVINPFALGLLNNLTLEHSYVPQLERSSVQTQGIRYNGAYSGYYPFYAKGTNNEWYQIDEASHPNVDAVNLKNWRPMGELTVLDEYGRPIESRDQIKVSSAVLYGYNRFNKLIPVAQAVNAKQHEIAYDSFDDYGYMSGSWSSSAKGHFDFSEALNTNVSLSTTQRHSGVSSLSVNNGITASVGRAVTPVTTCSEPVNSFSANEYAVQSCMCVKGFEPTADKEYVISLWVKGNAVNANNNYTDCSVSITYTGSGTVEYFYPTGQMLDGWQRIEGAFTIPASATSITVNLNNTSATGGAKSYFDDVRIHPFLAGMTTTVYDPETLLPMATHDGYNYTTFYGYDENLMPVRVKVETINGIQTVSESEGSTMIKFKN